MATKTITISGRITPMKAGYSLKLSSLGINFSNPKEIPSKIRSQHKITHPKIFSRFDKIVRPGNKPGSPRIEIKTDGSFKAMAKFDPVQFFRRI
ncbi:MAG: hypothetical protein B6I19_03765, partial [Bacteroidetes bacterium 4572_114]